MKDINITISLPLMSYPSDLALDYAHMVDLIADELWSREIYG